VRPLRIAFVSKHLSKGQEPKDGVAVYLDYISKGLEKRGFNVIRIWPQRGIMNIWPLYNIQAFKTISELAKERKIDIVHGNNTDGFLIPLSNLRIPYVLTLHTTILDEVFRTDEFLKIKKHIYRLPIVGTLVLAEKINVEGADVVVVPSKFLKSCVLKLYNVPPNKVKVIYHGIDHSEIEAIKRQVLKQRSKPKHVEICFIGKLVKRKGLIYLVRAAEELEKRYKIIVKIIGEGPEREFLEQYVKSHSIHSVRLLGALPRTDVLRELALCDIFCMPSLHESLGIAILEAMAMGKPIVASNVGGIPEVLDNAGILIPPRNVEALYNALEMLIIDEKLREELGMRAQERAQKFAWDRAVEQLIHAYEEVMSSR